MVQFKSMLHQLSVDMCSMSAVCFAFGQTGAGKTHTLLGTKSVRGLYELAASDLFALVDASLSLDVVASYYEIYCGQLYDLLAKRTRSSASRISLIHLSIVVIMIARSCVARAYVRPFCGCFCAMSWT